MRRASVMRADRADGPRAADCRRRQRGRGRCDRPRHDPASRSPTVGNVAEGAHPNRTADSLPAVRLVRGAPSFATPDCPAHGMPCVVGAFCYQSGICASKSSMSFAFMHRPKLMMCVTLATGPIFVGTGSATICPFIVSVCPA